MNPYGTAHQRLRHRLASVVAEGTVTCWRCGSLIDPDEPWDLGHADSPGAKTLGRYNGPEHRSCSRVAGGWKRRGVVAVRPRPRALGFFDIS
ncbi:conserved hypothetical protein [uncultured Mycobacterium sp.]|uniref:HNH endonuclease n=1 Tax=uncultured Mycobacterium sp. TaxID=171292 RepID=A0A1Y5PQN6_9MYCO|nr:conserved hypothetical protein [uncultured Mycobacterium sp.]